MATDAYRDPIYNLKAVVEKTGVTADALRAWERRYGLPDPARTEAGHRIYSQRDIDLIRWLVARQEEGLRIGRAVKLWRSLEDEGQDPLRSMPLPAEALRERSPTGDTVAKLRQEWLTACLAFDEAAAEQALARAFAMYPPELVCSEIIGAAIDQIGQSWYEGEVSPQQEHFASQLAMRRLKTLLDAVPPPTRRGRILAVCPPEEEHTLGLLTFALLIRRAGWDVVYLGANVPLKEMEQTLEATDPDLVVLSAQQLHTAVGLLDLARLVQEQDIPVAFGGRIFNQEPALRSRIPGHFLGSSLDQGIRQVEQLMTTARPTPEVALPSQADEEARSHYLDERAAIERDVWRAIKAHASDPQEVQETNEAIGRAIEAALIFGSMDLLGNYLGWLRSLDERHRPSVALLESYLRAYHQAAAEHLDGRGAPVVEWLGKQVAQHAERASTRG
jgi:DNA-binding transcriptional MerR regulator/methylmalonyl-CoA mutase cobalamin-binding subunit